MPLFRHKTLQVVLKGVAGFSIVAACNLGAPGLAEGNGAQGFFIDNLPREEEAIHGHTVRYYYTTSGSGDSGDWHCISIGEAASGAVLLPVGENRSYGTKDVSVEMSAEDCGEDTEKILFHAKELNKSDLIILNPVEKAAEKPKKIRSVPFKETVSAFGLFKEKGLSPTPEIQIGEEHIQFLGAYDLWEDAAPDLLIFAHSREYTHTYILGRSKGRWVILQIEYP